MSNLYGGAITANLPNGAIDVSDFRQIPDTQEVFLLEKSNGLDQSIIIDLLERVDASTLPEVLAVHLEDILDGPAQFLAPLEYMEQPHLQCEVHSFLVKPPPAKSETDRAKLYMYVILVRLEKVGTDVLVTMNVPVESGDVTAEKFQEDVALVLSLSLSVLAQAYTAVKETALSLDVRDWNLFG